MNSEFSSAAGNMVLRCGRLFTLANAALIAAKHIVFEKEPEKGTCQEPGQELCKVPGQEP